MKRHKRIVLSVFFLLAVAAPAAFGQVQTRVRIIQASNSGATIDPSLKDIHGQLGSLFNFTSYRLLRDEGLSLSPGRPLEINAHQGIGLEIGLVRKERDVAEYRVQIKRDGREILDTQIRLSPGRAVFIGGPKHGDGTIILAITARF
jgi:hypothetical protein